MDRSDLALAAKGWLTSAWTPFDVKMAMSDPMEHIQYLEAATVAPGAGADFVASKHVGLVKIEPRTARAEQWLDRAATGEASWDGNALVVELRYFPALADGAIAAGLTFERNA